MKTLMGFLPQFETKKTNPTHHVSGLRPLIRAELWTARLWAGARAQVGHGWAQMRHPRPTTPECTAATREVLPPAGASVRPEGRQPAPQAEQRMEGKRWGTGASRTTGAGAAPAQRTEARAQPPRPARGGGPAAPRSVTLPGEQRRARAGRPPTERPGRGPEQTDSQQPVGDAKHH